MLRAAFIFCGFLVSGLSALSSQLQADPARLLIAIRTVEEWQGRDGASGERGPWQITRAVWSLHMPGISFAKARQEGPARLCALKHIAWLTRQLEARNVPATAFNLAACWNAGLTGYTTGRAPVRAYEYAGRVENLYQALNSQPSTLN